MIQLPHPTEIKINNFDNAEILLKLLVQKVQEMDEREAIRDQGLAEEVIHLRKETREGLENLRQETREGFEKLEGRVDQNTLAIKALDLRMEGVETRLEGIDSRLVDVEKAVTGGFDNIGRILQEISNKLD